MIVNDKNYANKSKKRVIAHVALNEKETKKKVKLEEFNNASNATNSRDVDNDDNCGDDSILSESINTNSHSTLHFILFVTKDFVRGIRFT